MVLTSAVHARAPDLSCSVIQWGRAETRVTPGHDTIAPRAAPHELSIGSRRDPKSLVRLNGLAQTVKGAPSQGVQRANRRARGVLDFIVLE
jgi:hypothetical protein